MFLSLLLGFAAIRPVLSQTYVTGAPGNESVEYYNQYWTGGLFGTGLAPSPETAALSVDQVVGKGNWDTGGSGIYQANWTTHEALPNHTIYAPKIAPAFAMPVVVFANGACTFAGFRFANLLTELASQGYFIIANGPPAANGPTSQANVPLMKTALDWVMEGGDEGVFGKLDTDRIAIMGQSCGGLEAYSASWRDDRVKLLVILNSGILTQSNTVLLQDYNIPIAYFLGGPGDVAYKNGEADYKNLPAALPAFKASLAVGHTATYWEPNAGRFAKAIKAYFAWQFQSDPVAKSLLLDPASPLLDLGWNLTSNNWDYTAATSGNLCAF